MAEGPIGRRPRGRPRTRTADKDPAPAQALDKGMTLLSDLSRGGGATLTELSQRVAMPPSSAHRLLVTMQRRGMVDLDDTTQEWRIGVEAFRIGSAFNRRSTMIGQGRALMRDLVAETGETANLGIMDDGEVVFIDQVETSHPIRAFFRAGARAPMHASGIGKALLAELPRAAAERILRARGLAGFTPTTVTTLEGLFAQLEAFRARGWALDDAERHDGMRCVASAIFNEHGEPVAGISVSGPAARLDDAAIAGHGPLVRRAAERLTALTGGILPPSRAGGA